jgi:hypothetical protein
MLSLCVGFLETETLSGAVCERCVLRLQEMWLADESCHGDVFHKWVGALVKMAVHVFESISWLS